MIYRKGMLRENNPRWKGGKYKSKDNVFIMCKDHPNKNYHGYVREHRLVVEKSIGKYLKTTNVVHHINHIKYDNKNKNLVACEDQKYHLLIHQREKALRVSGNPNFLKCWVCKEYDSKENMDMHKTKNSAKHRDCYNKWQKNRRNNLVTHGANYKRLKRSRFSKRLRLSNC